jgi:hypothetical protein
MLICDDKSTFIDDKAGADYRWKAGADELPL